MWRSTLWISTLAAVLLGAGGCTAVSLSSLNSGVYDLALRKAGIAESGELRVAGSPISVAQIEADLMTASEEAEELAKSADTSRAAIAAWRVAAQAAWYAIPGDASQIDDKAVARAIGLAESGQEACEGVDLSESFTNPRDCALLQFIPAQVGFSVYQARFRALDAKEGDHSAADFAAIESFFSDYRQHVWDSSLNGESEARKTQGLDPSVGQYIDGEQFIFVCMALVRLDKLNQKRPLRSGDPAEQQKALEAQQQALDEYSKLMSSAARHYELTTGSDSAPGSDTPTWQPLRDEFTPRCVSEINALRL